MGDNTQQLGLAVEQRACCATQRQRHQAAAAGALVPTGLSTGRTSAKLEGDAMAGVLSQLTGGHDHVCTDMGSRLRLWLEYSQATGCSFTSSRLPSHASEQYPWGERGTMQDLQ